MFSVKGLACEIGASDVPGVGIADASGVEFGFLPQTTYTLLYA